MVDNSDNDDDDNASKTQGDFLDLHIDRTIQAIRIFLNPQHGNTSDEEAAAAIKINPATKKYAELKIKILKESARNAGKVMKILQAKQKEYGAAQDSEEIERLITEIDALKYLLFLVRRATVANIEIK